MGKRRMRSGGVGGIRKHRIQPCDKVEGMLSKKEETTAIVLRKILKRCQRGRTLIGLLWGGLVMKTRPPAKGTSKTTGGESNL